MIKNEFLLPLSVIIPVFAGLMVLLSKKQTTAFWKTCAVIGFGFPLFAGLYLYSQFDPTISYNFESARFLTGLQSFGITMHFGLNGISMPLYLMAGVVGFAAGIYAIQAKTDRVRLYVFLLLVMQAGLMGVFSSIDIFFFYFFHEFALIPTFIMIGIWGGLGSRSTAMEMAIYLTLGALASFVGLILIYMNSGLERGSFDFITLNHHLRETPMETIFQKNLYGILLFGFGVLVSLFPLHSWAPKSYSAAPTSAAMLHAGVLKKFGLYGLIQIAAPLLPEGVSHWATLLGWLALGNIVIIGLATISQTDLKQMVSYSSVMHMGYAFLGIASLNSIGTGGAVMLMFGHGLSVALLFLLTTYIYHRTDTFDMNDMGGLATKAPVLGAFFIAATMAGIGLPGFANFWGEFTIFMGIWGNESIQWMLYPAALGIVISAIYGLRAVAKVFYGEASASLSKHWENNKISDITLGEKIPALILIIALLLVGFYPGFISKMINRDIEGFRPEVMVGSNSIELSNIEKLNTDKIYQSQFVSLEHK